METRTFVFFDLETTGLPYQGNGPTKVTEIALIAAKIDHILDKHNGVTKENCNGDDLLPRVLDKINLTVYPGKLIQPKASEITGLTNENLELQGPFNENIFNILLNFFERQEKPICLVAHNGNRFDFPILQSELTKINKEFFDELFCADTLQGLREVLTNNQPDSEILANPACTEVTPNQNGPKGDALSGIEPLNNGNNMRAASLLPKCGWSCEEYDLELIQATELAEKFAEEYTSCENEELEKKIIAEMNRMRKINEHTPRRKTLDAQKLERRSQVKRKVLNDKKPKMKFDMKSLYHRTTGKELVNSHRAESDALALLEIVTAVGRPILEWMDRKRIPFKSIKKMW